MAIKRTYIVLLAAFLLSSCITSRKIDYLQDLQHESQIELEHKFQAVIQPNDELHIQIGSSDLEMTKPFTDLQYTPNGQVWGYLVDVNGNINIPVLGQIHVAGLTRLQLQDTLNAILMREKVIFDPYVTVRFLNFKVFIVGANTGRVINITNERCTLFEALATSGDLTDFTDRSRIAVIREIDGKLVTRYLDPRSSEILKDPFFMLQQNDLIVLHNMRVKNIREETSYWMSWVSAVFSFASLFTSLLLYNTLKK